MTVEEAIRHRWVTRNNALNARRMLRQRGEQLGYMSPGLPGNLYSDDKFSVPFPLLLQPYTNDKDDLSDSNVEDVEDSEEDEEVGGKRSRNEEHSESRTPPRLSDHDPSNSLQSNSDTPHFRTSFHRNQRTRIISEQNIASNSLHFHSSRSPRQRLLNVGGSQTEGNITPKRTFEEFVKSLALTTSTPCTGKDKGPNK